MKNMKQKHEHGTHLFPFELYNQLEKKGRMVCYLHWHEEVEWLYVYVGSISVYIDGEEHIVEQGHMIVIESHLLHYIIAREDCHYFTCVFHKNILKFELEDLTTRQFIMPYINNKLIIKNPIKINKTKVEKIFLKIVDVYNKQRIGYQLDIRIHLLVLFHSFIENQLVVENTYTKHKLESIEKLLNYIKNHYSEKITSQMLAEYVNYNHQYFSRFFKENTGYAPIEYINKYRIDIACEKLLDESKSILDISIECGFDSCSYFIKKFKEYKKTSPRQYRQMLLDNYKRFQERYEEI